MSIKLNHLVPKHDADKKCEPHDKNSRTHFFITTGLIEAKFNGTIQVDFICKHCQKRVTNFLTKEEYELHKKVLNS